MMPTCMLKHCKKAAVQAVFKTLDAEEWMKNGNLVFETYYLCPKHAKQFHKKYGV